MRKFTCSLTGSLLPTCFKVVVLAVVLLALLPAKRLITVETAFTDDPTRLAQDQVDSWALILNVGGADFSKEAGYLTPGCTIPIATAPVIVSHWHRGPPIFS